MELSKMFEVERDVEFGVEGYEPLRFNISTTPKGVDRLYFKDTDGCWIFAKAEMLTDIIHAAPYGIIHLSPPMTDEQMEQLRALYKIGYKWLAKDSDNSVYAYARRRPSKGPKVWGNDRLGAVKLYQELPSGVLSSLVSWRDYMPFDIGKALGYGMQAG